MTRRQGAFVVSLPSVQLFRRDVIEAARTDLHVETRVSLLNKRGGQPFDPRDEQALGQFAASIGVILETWNETTKARRMLRGATVTPAQIAR